MSDRRSYHIRIEDVIMHTEAIDHVCIGDGGDSLDVVMRCGQEYNFFTNDVERLLIAVTRVLNAEKISAD